MKRSSAELKALARTQLSGKYGIYIGAALVYNLISGAVSGITAMIFPTFSVSNMILEQSTVSAGSLILFYVVEFIISLILSTSLFIPRLLCWSKLLRYWLMRGGV